MTTTESNDETTETIPEGASAFARGFMEALRETERERDPAPMLERFGDDPELQRNGNAVHGGADGAEVFWNEYLETFREQCTTFHAVTETEHRAVLEWTSKGTRADGAPLNYSGVSVLERGDGGVAAFRTYYDSASFTEGEVVV